ncbi:MAG: aminotransferase class III-fold pyridoxal phosphate-dependent enzyme, partial [Planctomycetota bacterium]
PIEGKTFYHGHTFTGNALGCAAAVASIDLIFESNLLPALPDKIALIERLLAPLADHPHVGDIRQCGMMIGIELLADRAKGKAFDPAERVGAAVCLQARQRGIIIRPLGDVIVLMPAPAMDRDTLTRLCEGVVATIEEFRR